MLFFFRRQAPFSYAMLYDEAATCRAAASADISMLYAFMPRIRYELAPPLPPLLRHAAFAAAFMLTLRFYCCRHMLLLSLSCRHADSFIAALDASPLLITPLSRRH